MDLPLVAAYCGAMERDPATINAELAVLMRERLRIRGKDLASKLRKAGRLLPRRERKAGATLVEAERLWSNPKLRRQINMSELEEAATTLRRHLEGIDPAERRRGYWIGVLAPLAFNFLLIGALLVGWLSYSGKL